MKEKLETELQFCQDFLTRMATEVKWTVCEHERQAAASMAVLCNHLHSALQNPEDLNSTMRLAVICLEEITAVFEDSEIMDFWNEFSLRIPEILAALRDHVANHTEAAAA